MANHSAAVLLPSTSLGGAERMGIRIANDLAERGVETHIVLLNDTSELTHTISDAVTVHHLQAVRSRQAVLAVYRTLRRLRVDTVFSTLVRLNIMALALRPLLPGRPRIVVREPSNPVADMAVQGTTALYTPLYRWFYPRADRVICQSVRMSEEFDRLLGYRAANITQIYNPAPLDKLQARKADYPSPFSRPARFQLLTCGRLTERKGIHLLLQALAPLEQKGVDFRLTLLGDGPDRDAFEALTASLGLSERVEFRGTTLDTTAWYLHSDLFLQPSLSEGLPNTVIEAMACGTPVVASDCPGGTRELVKSGVNGEMFENADVADLTRTLNAVLPTLSAYHEGTVRQSISHLHPNRVFGELRQAILGGEADAIGLESVTRPG